MKTSIRSNKHSLPNDDDPDFRVILSIGDVFTRYDVDTAGAYRILRRIIRGLGPVPDQAPPCPAPRPAKSVWQWLRARQ